MPQAVDPKWPTSRLDDENDHTEAAAEAEDLPEIAERVRSWAPIVEAQRQKNRAHRRRQKRLEAKRQRVNRTLDKLVKKAKSRLDFHVEANHDHPDWKRHFPVAPSDFAKLPFADQAAAMKGWLQNPLPALADLTEPIAKALAKADEVLIEEINLGHAQKQIEGERAETAAKLTQLRDELHRDIAKIGDERGEDRDFADGCFL